MTFFTLLVVTLKMHFSFCFCSELKTVEFQANSQLKIIDDYAFFVSSLESISIPPHVTEIGEMAFGYCEEIKKIELKIIKQNSFCSYFLTKILIPSTVVEIQKKAFNSSSQLLKVEFAKIS